MLVAVRPDNPGAPDNAGSAAPSGSFLDVRALTVQPRVRRFWPGRRRGPIVDGVSLRVERGRTLVILGEAGSGGSTLARTIAGEPRDRRLRFTGEVWLGGRPVLGSADPAVRLVTAAEHSARERVGDHLVGLARVRHGLTRPAARDHAKALLRRVGAEAVIDRRLRDLAPEASRRVAVAAAISGEPTLLLVDDLTRGLDTIAQLRILDLLRTLRGELNAALVVLTADPGVAAEIGDDVLVLYAGRAVEHGSARAVLSAPEHPYTWGLLGSVPRPGRQRLRPIRGNPPPEGQPPPGCAFHPRCPYARLAGPACQEAPPELVGTPGGHRASCHLTPELRRRMWVSDIKPSLEPTA